MSKNDAFKIILFIVFLIGCFIVFRRFLFENCGETSIIVMFLCFILVFIFLGDNITELKFLGFYFKREQIRKRFEKFKNDDEKTKDFTKKYQTEIIFEKEDGSMKNGKKRRK